MENLSTGRQKLQIQPTDENIIFVLKIHLPNNNLITNRDV